MLSSNLPGVNVYSWLEGRRSKCSKNILKPPVESCWRPVLAVRLLSDHLYTSHFFFKVSQAILFSHVLVKEQFPGERAFVAAQL